MNQPKQNNEKYEALHFLVYIYQVLVDLYKLEYVYTCLVELVPNFAITNKTFSSVSNLVTRNKFLTILLIMMTLAVPVPVP